MASLGIDGWHFFVWIYKWLGNNRNDKWAAAPWNGMQENNKHSDTGDTVNTGDQDTETVVHVVNSISPQGNWMNRNKPIIKCEHVYSLQIPSNHKRPPSGYPLIFKIFSLGRKCAKLPTAYLQVVPPAAIRNTLFYFAKWHKNVALSEHKNVKWLFYDVVGCQMEVLEIIIANKHLHTKCGS